MGSFERIIQLVRSIPAGQVASYGQVAQAAGVPRGARMVGWALHGLSEAELAKTPWHRVVNRAGIISTTCEDHTGLLQKELLEREGVEVGEVDGALKIDLKKFGWLQS